jgi:serine/threonine protein kinase
LLTGFETGAFDDKSFAKVRCLARVERCQHRLQIADFGTARVDDREDGKLHTSVRTHANTKLVVGTSPYMSPEYERMGFVSEKVRSADSYYYYTA